MLGAERLEPQPEISSLFPCGEIAKIGEQLYRLVVVVRLLGGNKALHLVPKSWFLAGDVVEMLRPRNRCLTLSPGPLWKRCLSLAQHRRLVLREGRALVELTADLAVELSDRPATPKRLRLVEPPRLGIA